MLAIAGQTAELNWLKFFMKLMDIHPKAKKLIFFKMWIFFSNVRVKLFNALFWKKCLNSTCTSTKVFIYTFKKRFENFFFNNCSCFFLTKSKLDFFIFGNEVSSGSPIFNGVNGVNGRNMRYSFRNISSKYRTLKSSSPNCISPGTTSTLSNSTRTQPTWL